MLATAIWLSEKIFYYAAKAYHWENLVDFLNGIEYLICFIIRKKTQELRNKLKMKLVWSLLWVFFHTLALEHFWSNCFAGFCRLVFSLFQVNGMSSVTHIAMKDDIMILGDVTGALYLMNTSKKTMKRCSIWMNWKWQVVNMWFWTYTLSLMFP